MAKKYSRDEVIKHAKALGMPVPDNAATMSKSDYKDFTNNLNEFKAEETHKTEPAKEKAKEYRDTPEGKNYVAKAKAVKEREEAGGDTSGEYSIDDLPASVRREIDKEIPLEAFNYTEGLLSQIRQASPFVTGARSGGRMDYTTYGGSVKENTDYVNRYPDLKMAWQEILNNPNSETARYWLPRMGVTSPEDIKIERFGMAHQAENARLGADKYIGDTEVRPDGSRWDEWREGKDEFGQRDPTSDYWKGSILDPDAGTTVIPPVVPGVPTYTPGATTQPGAGGSGEYLATPYTRPALQDWSALAPPTMPGLLGSAQAQQSLLANNLANYQPWAQGGVLDYAPRGGSTWAPRTYSANPLDNSAAAAASSSSSSGDGYTGPLGQSWDNYQDWYMNSPYTSPSAANHQAALRRLYLASPDAEGRQRQDYLSQPIASVVGDEYFRDSLLDVPSSKSDLSGKNLAGVNLAENTIWGTPYTNWFYGEGGEGASAGPIFGGVLGNK